MIKKYALSVAVFLPILFSAQKKVSINPSVGFGWRLGKIPASVPQNQKNYLKDLKSGMNFGLSAYYHLNSGLGFGLKYNLFSSSARFISLSNILENKDKINFFGPGIIYSNFNQETRHKFHYDMAFGVISYHSKMMIDRTSLDFRGANFGIAGTMGYQYQVSPSILIGPQLGYTLGSLKKAKLNGVEVDLEKISGEKESLSEFSASLRITFLL